MERAKTLSHYGGPHAGKAVENSVMERGKRGNLSSFFGGAGFYIALLLCVVATGAVGYFVLFGGEKPVEDIPPAVTDVTAPDNSVAVEIPSLDMEDTEEPAPAAEVLEPQPVAEPASQPEPVEEVAQVMWPIKGETVSAFSVAQLQYSETLGDWRTHDGIDIAAAAGTQVVAAFAGTVLTAGEDSRLGPTVTVLQDDGYTVTYAGLQEELSVAEGDRVSSGQEIGTVGNTTLTESALGAHLHFAVSLDGEPVDPGDYLPQ